MYLLNIISFPPKNGTVFGADRDASQAKRHKWDRERPFGGGMRAPYKETM